MSRVPERVFVDTGAWIALAILRDPLHGRAREQWETLGRTGARLFTSLPVVLETFTYLDRRGNRELANAWRRSTEGLTRLTTLVPSIEDLDASWPLLASPEFHRLGIVDAMSFVLMRRHKIRTAFAFDTHFAVGGFNLVG